MSRKELPKPSLASWPIWKSMLGALYLYGLFTFFIWLFNSALHSYNTGIFSYSLTLKDVLLGSGWLLLVWWMHWAWQPRRKHGRWHRWLVDLTFTIYGLAFVLSGAMSYWGVLLGSMWGRVINNVLILLFLVAWILPALSYSAAKKLVRAQWAFNLRILSCGDVGSLMVLAGILGAGLGISVARNDEKGLLILFAAFLFSFVAILGSQYAAEHLWRYRPWAKEEDEE